MTDALKVLPSGSRTGGDAKEDARWYRKGLRFSCTECGGCCTGEPGHTWVNEEEALAIAEFLGIDFDTFCQTHLRRIANGRHSLKERSATYDCVFLDGKRCSIYPVRPKQCRTFPWWPENLASREAWEAAARRCEGITEEAPVVSYEEIQSQLHTPKEIL